MIAAEAYCAQNAGQEGYLALLDMLLRPGNGQAPMYAEACHLLAAKGARGLSHALHFTSAMVRHQHKLQWVTFWQLKMGQQRLVTPALIRLHLASCTGQVATDVEACSLQAAQSRTVLPHALCSAPAVVRCPCTLTPSAS